MVSRVVNIIFSIFILTGITGCFEKEDLITPSPINEISIPYSLYEYQIYYNLAEENIVSYNLYDTWDLGFESTAEGYHIILNSSRYMHAGDALTTDFEAVVTNIADTMIYDDSSGDLSGTALAGWIDNSDPENPVFTGNVFIIDRGLNEAGESFGMIKLVIEKLEGGVYYLRYANLDNSGEVRCQVVKEPGVNFVLFSFDQGGISPVQQPASSEWDLCFTKYSTVIDDDYGTPTPYLVRGVFINNMAGITAVTDSISSFYEIDLSDAESYSMSQAQDVIGYGWKEYRNDNYTLIDGLSYIIRDQNGDYYKIRFTNYFSEAGQRGYPAFEQIQLSE